jgi:hypothetical protein
MGFKVGAARKVITPQDKVELAGLGYYLGRVGERIRDDLAATALVVTDHADQAFAIVALDIMYGGDELTAGIRERVSGSLGFPSSSICVHCSHTHNAPTARSIRGAGDANLAYLAFVIEQASAAVIEAYSRKQPARLYAASTLLEGLTYNRTRNSGPVDTRLNVFSAKNDAGDMLALAVNFHAHPCAQMEMDLFAVSRDVPGEVVDQIEARFPGATSLYLQGTCGDVNFKPKYSWPERYQQPGKSIAATALEALDHLRPVADSGIRVIHKTINLPTRRWGPDEIAVDRDEGAYRLRTGDISGWQDGIARNMVVAPSRLPQRYSGSVDQTVAAISRFAMEWTDDMLAKVNGHPTSIATEVQAIRIGDIYFVAHPAELFTSHGLEIRRRWPSNNLFFLGYSNGAIGYVPDEYDVEHRSYAAINSPKNRGEFPYTADAGNILVEELLEALQQTMPTPLSG